MDKLTRLILVRSFHSFSLWDFLGVLVIILIRLITLVKYSYLNSFSPKGLINVLAIVLLISLITLIELTTIAIEVAAIDKTKFIVLNVKVYGKARLIRAIVLKVDHFTEYSYLNSCLLKDFLGLVIILFVLVFVLASIVEYSYLNSCWGFISVLVIALIALIALFALMVLIALITLFLKVVVIKVRFII